MFEHSWGITNGGYVAIGAIPGACLRFMIANQMKKRSFRTYLPTCVVNLTATFALGLLISCHSEGFSTIDKSPLILCFGVGFLGSLSTFSTFILELRDSLRVQDFKEFISVLILSIFGGLIVGTIGYGLGKA